MAGPTKGPWRVVATSQQVDECTLGLQIWARDVRIAFTEQQNVGIEQEKSNANVLAAAWELLEALKAYETLDDQRMKCKECEDCLERAPEACQECFPFADDARLKMRAAIAKTEGR